MIIVASLRLIYFLSDFIRIVFIFLPYDSTTTPFKERKNERSIEQTMAPTTRKAAAGTKAKCTVKTPPVRMSKTQMREDARRHAKEWIMRERARKMTLSSLSPNRQPESSSGVGVVALLDSDGEEEDDYVENYVEDYVEDAVEVAKVAANVESRGVTHTSFSVRNNAAPRVVIATTGMGEVLEERFRHKEKLPASARKAPQVPMSMSCTKLNLDIRQEVTLTPNLGSRINNMTEMATVAGIQEEVAIDDEDIFYDAFEHLPDSTNISAPVVVVGQPRVRMVQAKIQDGNWKTVPLYEKGMCVNYMNAYGVQVCTVLAVDLDGWMEPYYTVRFQDGKEKQTDNDHLALSVVDEDYACSTPVPVEPEGMSFTTFVPHGDP